MAEVKLGQLATSKGQNQKVKDFGQKMVDDHSKANNELTAIVQRKNLTAPSGLTSKDQALMDRLQRLSGDAFDKAYMSAMVKDHETDIAEFEKEANSGSDADFKNFAAKTLTTLREHLNMARQDAATVGASQ
jgi:putative membrane protein